MPSKPIGSLQLQSFTWYKNAIQESKRASDALRQTKGLHYLKMVISCLCYPSASVALQHGSFVPREGSATRDFSTWICAPLRVLVQLTSLTQTKELAYPHNLFWPAFASSAISINTLALLSGTSICINNWMASRIFWIVASSNCSKIKIYQRYNKFIYQQLLLKDQ